MNHPMRPARRTIAKFLTSQSRSHSIISAPAASLPNRANLLPEQLQYGKLNKPSPSRTHKRLDQIHANIPTYPHPRKYWYKKANLGLYGHLSVRYGNTISEQNKHRNPRNWHPNVHRKRLWSECLGRFIRLKIATRIIRTVDKCGGLDNYLLGNRPGRIRELGMAGWALRWRVLRTPKGRVRAMEERKALGLSGEPMWMDLPFASKWLAAYEKKHGIVDLSKESIATSKLVPITKQAALVEEVAKARADEAAAAELQKQIDEEFDIDDQAATRGEDGGIEIGNETEVHDGEKK